MIDRDNWPVHEPECFDAPIPGRQWYSGCEPGGDLDYETGRYHGTGPRVNPATGLCEGCGAKACRYCGRENCPDHPDVCDHEATRLVQIPGERLLVCVVCDTITDEAKTAGVLR